MPQTQMSTEYHVNRCKSEKNPILLKAYLTYALADLGIA